MTLAGRLSNHKRKMMVLESSIVSEIVLYTVVCLGIAISTELIHTIFITILVNVPLFPCVLTVSIRCIIIPAVRGTEVQIHITTEGQTFQDLHLDED